MLLKILRWLDTNLIFLLAGFLLVFIPLYPKVPVFDILYGYNVRVRLEDFFVGLTLAVFLLQVLRRRVRLSLDPVTFGLGAYLLFGFISALVAIFVIKTVPLEYLHVAKTMLHWLRRVEYFSLFFIAFGAVRSLRVVRIYIILFFLTLFAVTIYGYGQKYLYWPAFSTMNREFSKGWVLYLTEHARVLSTFGGHYDLAGYLVIALSLSWSFFFGLKSRLYKVTIGILIGGGFWLLILTASRISFVSYIVGLSAVVFLWMFRKGFGWGVSRWFITVGLSMLVMLSFGDLSDRFLRLVKLDTRVAGIKQILLSPTGKPPDSQAMFLENNLLAVANKSDVPPTPVRPADVSGNEPKQYMTITTASGSSVIVEKPRTYSQNSVLYDLSTGIRLDATWPKAIAGFRRDPILGSGYATLTKNQVTDFTEAESTDNDYLRALGETGLLGFLAFFGTIGIMMWLAFRALGGIKDPYIYAVVAGFVALSTGLLVNATYIDIFESSKVAYVFWGVSGITMGIVYLLQDKIKEDREPMRIVFPLREYLSRFRSFLGTDRFWVAVLVILAFYLRTYRIDTSLADWHSWRQADTSAVTRNFLKADTINWLYPTYDDLSSIASGKENPKGLRFVEFPLYNAAAFTVKKLIPELEVEVAGRVTTILASMVTLVFIFLLSRRYLSRRIAYLAAATFAVLPYALYYGRVILPDPLMVALSLGGLWFAGEFIDTGKKRFFLLLAIFAALALLVKPFAVFLLLPIGYLWLVGGRDFKKLFWLIVAGVLAGIPLLLWRYWISHFPEGIPASDWLFNGDGIRFKGAFWYWLFADRIGRLMLGFWGLVLLGFGFVKKVRGNYWLFPVVLLFSSVMYLIIFATGNVRHDYYQILLLPSLAIMVGVGLDSLLSGNFLAKFLAVVSFCFMLGFGWYFVRDYYNINHPEIAEAGRKLNTLAEDNHKKAMVIAPYGGDTAFLYQTNHAGWPIMEGSIEEMIKKDAGYYVSVSFDDLTKQLITDSWPVWEKPDPKVLKKYKLLVQTDKYVIIQLVPDKQLAGN